MLLAIKTSADTDEHPLVWDVDCAKAQAGLTDRVDALATQLRARWGL